MLSANSQLLMSGFFSATSFEEDGAPSSIAVRAEYRKARIPKASAWPKVAKPRKIGYLSQGYFSAGRSRKLWTTAIEPFGFRTATAYECGERIITPSMTACPPTSTSSVPWASGTTVSLVVCRKPSMIVLVSLLAVILCLCPTPMHVARLPVRGAVETEMFPRFAHGLDAKTRPFFVAHILT